MKMMILFFIASSFALALPKSFQETKDGEQYQCYPNQLVKRWQSKPKKVVRPVPTPVENKVVVQHDIVERWNVQQHPKNSLSLLGGRSQTSTSTNYNPTTNVYTVKHGYELDYGLMYQRDLGHNFKASIIGTRQVNWYLGLGYDFDIP